MWTNALETPITAAVSKPAPTRVDLSPALALPDIRKPPTESALTSMNAHWELTTVLLPRDALINWDHTGATAPLLMALDSKETQMEFALTSMNARLELTPVLLTRRAQIRSADSNVRQKPLQRRPRPLQQRRPQQPCQLFPVLVLRFFRSTSKQHGKERREFADLQVASSPISVTALSSRLSTRTVLVITAANGSAFDGLRTTTKLTAKRKSRFSTGVTENLTTREEMKNASRFTATTNGTTRNAKKSDQLAADSSIFDIAEISHLDKGYSVYFFFHLLC
jgi:hypothetical protein